MTFFPTALRSFSTGFKFATNAELFGPYTRTTLRIPLLFENCELTQADLKEAYERTLENRPLISKLEFVNIATTEVDALSKEIFEILKNNDQIPHLSIDYQRSFIRDIKEKNLSNCLIAGPSLCKFIETTLESRKLQHLTSLSLKNNGWDCEQLERVISNVFCHTKITEIDFSGHNAGSLCIEELENWTARQNRDSKIIRKFIFGKVPKFKPKTYDIGFQELSLPY